MMATRQALTYFKFRFLKGPLFTHIASLVDVRAKGTIQGLAVGARQGINFLDRAAVAVDDLPRVGDLGGVRAGRDQARHKHGQRREAPGTQR